MNIKKLSIGIFASSPSLTGHLQALSAHRQIQNRFDTQGMAVARCGRKPAPPMSDMTA